MTLNDRELLLIVREALLMLVDVVERKLELPRTKELRARLRALEYENKSVIIAQTTE
jgi:hypothetical protein